MRITPNDSDLDMMIAKFIINLPNGELRQDRIWFHLQRMFYYFIDEVVDLEPLNDFQQQDKEMKEFYSLVVDKMPSFIKLDANKILKMINDGYSDTPVFGVIIFNLEQTKILLVESHKPASMYGVPKGKINEGQTPLECAQRQVKEQVGINVQLSQSHRIEIQYSKSCCFYVCKMDENHINVSFVKNTEAEKLKGKKKTSKEIKSLVWLQLHNPLQLKLNIATKKVIDKIRSDKAMSNGSRQSINPNSNPRTPPTTSRQPSNGYIEIDQQRGMSRKNKYVEVPNEITSPQLWKEKEVKCPFDRYEIKNRRMLERLFCDNAN